jgi:ribonuclease PH
VNYREPIVRATTTIEGQQRQRIVEHLITNATSECVLLKRMPRTQITLTLQVLHDDGYGVSACVNAARYVG